MLTDCLLGVFVKALRNFGLDVQFEPHLGAWFCCELADDFQVDGIKGHAAGVRVELNYSVEAFFGCLARGRSFSPLVTTFLSTSRY